MIDFLDKIKLLKEEEVEALKQNSSPVELKARVKDLPPTRDFGKSLKSTGVSLIAEVKKRSPSAGVISDDFDPPALARSYQAGGAAAISVLTDRNHFAGELSHLSAVKEAVSLPVLRKDFILDDYQIYESRLAGADAVLLIAELLAPDEIKRLLEFARMLGLSCLAEAHSRGELEKVILAGAEIIGVNNRDLKTFRVKLETSWQLLPLVPDDRLKVSESGIQTADDFKLMAEAGADAILVGEALMRSEDRTGKMKEMLGEANLRGKK